MGVLCLPATRRAHEPVWIFVVVDFPDVLFLQAIRAGILRLRSVMSNRFSSSFGGVGFLHLCK